MTLSNLNTNKLMPQYVPVFNAATFNEGSSTNATFTSLTNPDGDGINYRLATFNASGTLVIATSGYAQCMMIGGGGGGGVSGSRGGGGGAGGMIYIPTLSISSGSYSIVVGGGGGGNSNGTSSTFAGYTARAGSGGARDLYDYSDPGGCSGGGRWGTYYSGDAVGVAPFYLNIGNRGGVSTSTNNTGGGGGIGGRGGDGSGTSGGGGGAGLAFTFSGSSVTYGIGGPGMSTSTTPGRTNRGDGGVGYNGSGGSAGGSGIVMVRVRTN